MRIDLLGLDVEKAQAILAAQGVRPQITVTSAPKRLEQTRGTLRVVHASDDGTQLTVARFLDPLSEAERKTGGDGES